jgi:hypothetical protein
MGRIRRILVVEFKSRNKSFLPIQQKLALASPTSGGRSVGIVRLRTTDHRVCLLFVLSKTFVFKIRDNTKNPNI